MSELDLIRLASEAYGDDEALVLRYWAAQHKQKLPELADYPAKPSGDTLAQFIALELSETFDADASTDEQLGEAMRVMSSAEDQLNRVVMALGDRRFDEEKALQEKARQ